MENQVLEFLKQYHTGRENAAQSYEIERAFQIRGSDVRKVINSLRCEGQPICSDQNGYYYAACESELNLTVRQLTSRISKIARAKNGLLHAATRLFDNRQTTLPL